MINNQVTSMIMSELPDTYHDSHLIDLVPNGNDLILVINVDVYWAPGEPFALLKLSHVANHDELLNFWQTLLTEQPSDCLSPDQEINIVTITKNQYGYLDVRLDMIFKDVEFTLACQEFTLTRVPTYAGKRNFFPKEGEEDAQLVQKPR